MLLWVQLIFFILKVVLLRWTLIHLFHSNFLMIKVNILTLFLCFSFTQFTLNELIGQFLSNLTLSFTCESYKVFQIFMTLVSG